MGGARGTDLEPPHQSPQTPQSRNRDGKFSETWRQIWRGERAEFRVFAELWSVFAELWCESAELCCDFADLWRESTGFRRRSARLSYRSARIIRGSSYLCCISPKNCTNNHRILRIDISPDHHTATGQCCAVKQGKPGAPVRKDKRFITPGLFTYGGARSAFAICS